MKKADKHINSQVKKKQSPLLIFIITFVVLTVLTSFQSLILGLYIDFDHVPVKYVFTMNIYWLIVSVIFTIITRYQIKKRFEKPVLRLADATRKVANGDFSIYIKPMHTIEKADYIDAIFQDFNKMVEELGSMETLKTDFFSNVSHEIKTPLSVIQSYAQALQKEDLSAEKRKEYTDTIVTSSKRLSGLITNILKLNKLEKQTIQPKVEPYDVCRQLCECALYFENLWEKKEIEFIVEIEDSAFIEADESLMELIWNNLLSNAIKFTAPGGIVTLQQFSREDEVVVTISDTGCGMSEETMAHIFDKFYQGDTSHSTEGNGLGLALVLRILQLMDGTITAGSRLGEGSTFTVRIPAVMQKEEEFHE